MDKINKELEFPVEFFSKLEGIKDINNFLVNVMEKISSSEVILNDQLIEGYLSTRNEDMLICKDFEYSDMENL